MKKLIAMVLALAMALSFAACTGEDEPSPAPSAGVSAEVSEEPSAVPSADASEEPSAEPSAEASAEPAGFTVSSEDISDVNIEITYPVFSSSLYADFLPDVNEYFLSRARQTEEGFIADREDAEDGDVYSIEQSCTVEYAHGSVASVLIATERYYGGVHPTVMYEAHTVDLDGGTLVSLYDVFPEDGEAVRDAILGEIISQLDGREDLYDDAEDAARELFDVEHFYLTDEGLVVFYQAYELGAYVAGPQFFTIPYESISENAAEWLSNE